MNFTQNHRDYIFGVIQKCNEFQSLKFPWRFVKEGWKAVEVGMRILV